MIRNLLFSVGCLGIVLSYYILTGASVDKTTSYHDKTVLRSNGPSGGLTGAPGEGNCTTCHGGAVIDGNIGMNSVVLEGSTENIIPGETISVNVSLTDGSDKNGFQVVALDENEEMAGTFVITDNTNTQSKATTFNQRLYVTHTSDGNSFSSWEFDWEVPLGIEQATFYLATNKTNNNGSSSGDQIHLSSHLFTVENAALENEIALGNLFEIKYVKEMNRLVVDFTIDKSDDLSLNITDLNGRSVHYEKFNALAPGEYTEHVNIQTSLNKGIYIASFFVGNRPISKKFRVQ